MEEEKYYNEIATIIERVEINTKVRQIQDNSEKLLAYWTIGKLIVEAQGGKNYSKYGNSLINKWAVILANKYGSFYKKTNLYYMRQFYLQFINFHAVGGKLNWTQIRIILPIKNKNERNYYINLCITNNLSSRELINEIKNKAFERLSYADKENIKLIEDNNYTLTIKDMIKDPILLKIDKNINSLDEKVIHKYLINMLEDRFLELGMGFTLAGHEYKITVENHTFRIDLLFFNYKLNSFVVVEVKTREMKIKDCDQISFYTSLIDSKIKEPTNNKTIGLLIVKEKDSFVLKYATNKELLVSTYKLIKDNKVIV